MPPETVKIARPGFWGNPFRVEVFGRELALKLYRESVEGFWSPDNVASLSDELAAEAYRLHSNLRIAMRTRDVRELRGQHLACWCRLDQDCHAEVLLEIANRPL